MREFTGTASRRLVAGGLLWVSLVQMLVVNNFVVLPHASSQDLEAVIISALGITRCRDIAGIRFCSPWHEAADIAWIVGGVCVFLGAVLNVAAFPPGRLRKWTFAVLAVSGLGLVSSGFNPYNLRPLAHLLSAGVCFTGGAVGVVLLGHMLRRAGHHPYWGMTGIVCGAVSLVAALVTAIRPDPRTQGVFERTSAWPSILWIIGTGVLFAWTAWRARRSSPPLGSGPPESA
ncbi:DUF998 domain-containing protein [Streptomyces sp. NPDC085932]|uniref:DUF998 domain-containing protein n=1 Tax=Streptomyces sp. NPDC085932 TaxID=3365741 RepID=UPI0037D64EF4